MGLTGVTEPRLVVSSNLADTSAVKYTTLSYCWGPKVDADKQLKTERLTYDSRCYGMPLDTMTPVLRDAVMVCRSLGIRYIWVDALCIVQDDMEDWARESEVMGLVYYHAYLTICPLASRSCLEGFLGPRPPGIQIGFCSSLEPTIQGTISLYESHNDRDLAELGLPSRLESGSGFDLDPPKDLDISLAAWSTRGWTFQEEHCSFRMLYFGKNMIHFTCTTWGTSENCFQVSGDGVQGPFRELFNSFSESSKSTQSAEAEVAPWESPAFKASATWEVMSPLITRRMFTYRQDIFPALAGMAKAAAQVQNDTYLAGLWKKGLHRGLLWYIPTPQPDSLEVILANLQSNPVYIAPSWSWVSTPGYIEYLAPFYYSVSEIDAPTNRHKMFAMTRSRPSHILQEFTLLYHQILQDGFSLYGRIKHASLRFRGKLLRPPSTITMHPKSKSAGRPPFGYFANNHGSIYMDWCVTEKTELPPGDMVLFVTASCCQATSNEVLRWQANPDEDHTQGLGERAVRVGGDVTMEEAIREGESCLSCADGRQGRNVWGLVLHPTQTAGPYYRVGAFVLFGHAGGLGLFEAVDWQEVEIV